MNNEYPPGPIPVPPLPPYDPPDPTPPSSRVGTRDTHDFPGDVPAPRSHPHVADAPALRIDTARDSSQSKRVKVQSSRSS